MDVRRKRRTVLGECRSSNSAIEPNLPPISMWSKNLLQASGFRQGNYFTALRTHSSWDIPCAVWREEALAWIHRVPLTYSMHSTWFPKDNSKKHPKFWPASSMSTRSWTLIRIIPMAGYSCPERRRCFKSWADFHMLLLYLADSFTPVWLQWKRLRGPPRCGGKPTLLNTLSSHQIPLPLEWIWF